MDSMGFSPGEVPEERKEEVEKEKAPERAFSPEHARIIEDAGEILRLDSLENFRDLEGLEKVRNAEILLQAAELARAGQEAGMAVGGLDFPDSYEDAKRKVQDGEFGHHENDLLMYLDMNTERLGSFVIAPEKGKEIVRQSVFDAFKRRLEFFKKCQQTVEELGLSTEEIEDRQMEYRSWQMEKLEEAVEMEPPEVLKGFSEDLQAVLMESAANIELNEGCTVGCSFCAFSAEKKMSNALPFSQAAWLSARSGERASFFRATDPLDYVAPDDPSRSYADLLTISEIFKDRVPFTSTAYPHGSAERMKKISNRVQRVSVSYMNRRRLENDGLYEFPEENTAVPVDPDLADGLYFNGVRDLSHHIGQVRSQPDRRGKEQMVKWALAFTVFGETNKPIFRADSPDLKVSGKQRERAKRISGRKEEVQTMVEDYSGSIECLDGVTITPSKVMNMVPMFTSDAFPTGKLDVNLTPERIAAGQAALTELSDRFWSDEDEEGVGESLTIGDVLPHGVVVLSFGSKALEVSGPEALKDMKTGMGTFERSLTYDDLTHKINLETFSEDGEQQATWEVTYHQVDGRVMNLKELERFD